MLKVILLAKRRPDLTGEEFRSSYSGRHVPMMSQLLEHGAAIQRRNFVVHQDPSNRDGHDVITDAFFEDRETAEATFREMADLEKRRLRIEDEKKFLLTYSIKILVVETETTVIRPKGTDTAAYRC